MAINQIPNNERLVVLLNDLTFEEITLKPNIKRIINGIEIATNIKSVSNQIGILEL
jgi:hypothetical protein